MVTSSSDKVGAGSPTGPSSLHIGWWRNGFHEYEPAPTKLNERQIRKLGALVAAAICVVWIAAALAGLVALVALGSPYYAVPALVEIGAIAAVPMAAACGWRLAILPEPPGTNWFLGAVLVVVLTDVEIAIIVTAALVVVAANPMTILIGPLGALGGLAIFGLPGLAMAVPSAWYWERVMRRTFTTTARAGGDRGSADQRR